MERSELKKNIAVLFGGRSLEHEISIITALQLMDAADAIKYNIIPVYISQRGKWYTGEALRKKEFYSKLPYSLENAQEVTLLPDPTVRGLSVIKKQKINELIPVDVYFLSFHGEYGEDGAVQGLLEMADAVYTGCNILSSALVMNKHACKMFLKASDIPVLPSFTLRKSEITQNLIGATKKLFASLEGCQYPLFIKPCNLGSSIGISKAFNEVEFYSSLAKAFQYDTEVIIEPFVEQLMEINVAVLDGKPPRPSVVEIPVASKEFLTYEDKYIRKGNKTNSLSSDGMAGLTRIIDPQDLDKTIQDQVTGYALKAFEALHCSGNIRIDFMLDLKTDKLYFNELNPLPGSFAYYLWEKSHPPLLYPELINEIIQIAENNAREKKSLQKDFGFKAIFN